MAMSFPGTFSIGPWYLPGQACPYSPAQYRLAGFVLQEDAHGRAHGVSIRPLLHPLPPTAVESQPALERNVAELFEAGNLADCDIVASRATGSISACSLNTPEKLPFTTPISTMKLNEPNGSLRLAAGMFSPHGERPVGLQAVSDLRFEGVAFTVANKRICFFQPRRRGSPEKPASSDRSWL
jgi:hypothetical protein